MSAKINERETGPRRVPWGTMVAALYVLVIHAVSMCLALTLFRLPDGSYFAFNGANMMQAMVSVLGLCISPFLALFHGKGRQKLLRVVIAAASCFTAFWLYGAIEGYAFRLKGFSQ